MQGSDLGFRDCLDNAGADVGRRTLVLQEGYSDAGVVLTRQASIGDDELAIVHRGLRDVGCSVWLGGPELSRMVVGVGASDR